MVIVNRRFVSARTRDASALWTRWRALGGPWPIQSWRFQPSLGILGSCPFHYGTLLHPFGSDCGEGRMTAPDW